MVMAFAEARAGQFDSAFVRFDQLMSIPSWMSVHLLQETPGLPEAFRQDPRYKALIARGDKVF
jgi:hypothetical protein